ncbi:porin [bacterium]|nr:porin [bacterium]
MKLFQQLLVAGATMSLIAPMAAQASDAVNLEEMNSYARSRKKSSKLDSKTFINKVSEDIATLEDRVNGIDANQKGFEAGTFSDTTTLGQTVAFTLSADDYALATNTTSESLKASYKYQWDVNTSFTGDDNLYIRLKSGNHTGSTVSKTYGTYLSSGSKFTDLMKVDKIWYTFPAGERHTFYVGPRIENYYMHGTTPSIYKPVTKQFTLGGNGNAYGASTNAGAGWAYKFDNGFAVSSNFVSSKTDLLTNEGATSWANQVGYTNNQWSASVIVNSKYNSWHDEYYHSTQDAPASDGENFTAVGVRTWWRPLETGTMVPSISLGYDTTGYNKAPNSSNSSNAWFTGLQWQDAFQADDRVGIAFGQPTVNEAETIDPFAFEMYYSFKINDAVTMTPAYFQNTNRAGTAGDDVSGVVLETVFKF